MTHIFRCEFKALYNDLQDEEKIKLWQCDEDKGSSSQFCCFHDKTKQQWDYQTFERLRKMILDSETTGKNLFLIGYYFPANISFKLLLLNLDPNPPPLEGEKYKKYEDGVIRDTNQRICRFPIYLCDSEFNGQVEFSHCTFDNTLNLAGAIFRREVLFRDAIFRGKFYPRSTKFYGKTDFRKTEFNEADFHDTVFKDKANFRRSKIFNKTRFLDVKFQDRVNFVDAVFYNDIEFIGTSFNKAFFSPDVKFQSKTKFKYVVFEDGEKILFAIEDLSNISFENTDITRVRFSDKAVWGKYHKIFDEMALEDSFKKSLDHAFRWINIPTKESDNNRLRNFLKELSSIGIVGIEEIHFNKKDEETIEIIHKGNPKLILYIRLNKDKNKAVLIKQEKDKEENIYEFLVKGKFNLNVYPNPRVSLESIRAIYRNLRENYEYRLRYDEAGEFFIREMELKRNYHQDSSNNLKRTHPLKKRLSITGLYYTLFRYGERLLRPTLIVVLPFLGLSVLLTYIVHDVSLMHAAKITLSDLIQMEIPEPLLSDSFIRILSLGILAMYLIPLRRKFERKFRH